MSNSGEIFAFGPNGQVKAFTGMSTQADVDSVLGPGWTLGGTNSASPLSPANPSSNPSNPSGNTFASLSNSTMNNPIIAANQSRAQQMIDQFAPRPSAPQFNQFSGNPFLRQANAQMGQPSAPMQPVGLGGSRAPATSLVPQQQMVAPPMPQQQHLATGGMARGGISNLPRARGFTTKGLLHTNGPGRTDNIPANVPSGSYVIPSDVVSGLGDGNTLAGAKIMDSIFKQGPYGTTPGKTPRGMGVPKAPGIYNFAAKGIERQAMKDTYKTPKDLTGTPMAFKDGGETQHVPIIAAGGEYVIPPEVVALLGGGDIKKGHKVLDHFVKMARAKTIKEMKKLPGPKR